MPVPLTNDSKCWYGMSGSTLIVTTTELPMPAQSSSLAVPPGQAPG